MVIVNKALSSDLPLKTPAQKNPNIDNPYDVQLFGSLWPLSERFKLDPTVDPRVLEAQEERLLKLGYKYILIAQIWIK